MTNELKKTNEMKLNLNDELMAKFNKLPEIVEPKHLAEMFNIDAKLVRTVLRKTFPQHEKNTGWKFKKSGNAIKLACNELTSAKTKSTVILD